MLVNNVQLSLGLRTARDQQKLLSTNYGTKLWKLWKNATGYKCEKSPTTNDLNVAQIPKIYIALQCMFNFFITAFMQIINLLTRRTYLPRIHVYSENEVCVSLVWSGICFLV